MRKSMLAQQKQSRQKECLEMKFGDAGDDQGAQNEEQGSTRQT